MNPRPTKEELEVELRDQTVYSVLNDIHMATRRWTEGGALLHRVLALGMLAERGAEAIAEGSMSITTESTFADMRELDKKNYAPTINFVYNLVMAGIYSP